MRKDRLLAAWFCWTLCSTVGAEVAVGPSGTVVLGIITEDPNPIGVWLQYRPVPSEQVLNADGHLRGDGPPDLAWKADSRPAAVWAYNAGSDFDIAFAEWDGAAWTATEFLTTSTQDERNPRLFIESDGTMHVVWWTQGEEVYLSTRGAGSSVWDGPVPVTTGGETGRRPAVAVSGGELFVAYECPSAAAGMLQDVRAAMRQPNGTFNFETVGSTLRTGPLDVVLHAEQGHVWADWKHEVDEFGFAERVAGDGWSDGAAQPWTDPSWVGVEGTRRVIRSLVLP
jgi:hypothetical protein